jgi:hypothetical protein
LESIIPDSFKNAVVSQIHKSGDKSIINNYRPIGLLDIFSINFARAIKASLMKYLEENNILPKSQYGYRNNLETEDL